MGPDGAFYVYADVSALHYRPFQLYHSLMLVQEYGVWDKVLFGTDWPVIDFERAVTEIGELGLKESVMNKLFWENAVRVYGLEEWV